MPCGLGELTCLLTLTRFVADSSSQLSELQNLNNLRGRLSIMIRGQTKGAAEGRMEGTNYLEAKEYLKTLELDFHRVDDELEEALLLESLRPHPNLKELIVYSYGGVSFPSWMMVDKIGLSPLPNLVRITIDSCDRCKNLPLFGLLPSLQFLRLSFMCSLEYIDNSSSGSGSGSGGEESLSSSLPSSSSGGAAAAARRTFFPSLKELTLWQLRNLKGWWRTEVEEEATITSTIASPPAQQQPERQHLSQPYWLLSFPSLSKLIIIDCPNLVSMPILQPFLEELLLNNVSRKLIHQDLMMTVAMSSSSPSSSHLHLSKLKSLSLGNIQDQDTLPVCIGNLKSLERLFIFNCPNLLSLPEGMRHLLHCNNSKSQMFTFND